jgi:hypothetical protein
MATKNLGWIKAIKSGTTAPTNEEMLWYDTNLTDSSCKVKYYDSTEGDWVLMSKDFSDHFKIVDGVVYLNVDLITAESESDDSSDYYQITANDDGSIVDWSESLYSISYDSSTGESVCTALSDWEGTDLTWPTLQPFYLFEEGCDALAAVNSGSGDYVYIEFDMSINQILVDSNARVVRLYFYGDNFTSVPSFLLSSDTETVNCSVRRNLPTSLGDINYVTFGVASSDSETILVPTGSVFTFSNLNIYRSDS